MFPSKNVLDYVGESSRYFATNIMDGDTNTYNSPFQTPVANRYSSSTDSTSPESSFNTPSLELTRPRSITPKSCKGQLQSVCYDTFALDIFDSSLNFDSHSSNYNKSSFDRNVSDFTPLHYDKTSTPFDKNFAVFEPQSNTQNQPDTQFQFKNQRAIVGRKILGCHSKISANDKFKSDTDVDYNIWQPKHLQTRETTQMLYELFPSYEKSFEFSPLKRSTDCPSNFTQKMSPSSSIAPSPYFSQSVSPTPNKISYSGKPSPPTTHRLQYTENLLSPTKSILQYNESLSPTSSNRNFYPENISQNSIKIMYPVFKPPYNPSSYTGASSSRGEIGPSKICMFCRKNGETATVYMDHCVKEKIGNRYKVTCPILRALVCMTCGATGDDAHTITYCPVLRTSNNGKPLQSTTVTLKSTRIKSDGTKRNKI